MIKSPLVELKKHSASCFYCISVYCDYLCILAQVINKDMKSVPQSFLLFRSFLLSMFCFISHHSTSSQLF